jgi:hypothetical protein
MRDATFATTARGSDAARGDITASFTPRAVKLHLALN